MNIAIVGFGLEGQAAYEYWKKGNTITVLDENPDSVLPEGVAGQLGASYLDDLESFDLIVRSPFVRPEKLVAASSPDILNKVTTNTNEFLSVCPTKNIIGVTGTKGKGTTSTLIAAMLKAAGKHVHLGGNIGVPTLNLLSDVISPEDYVVLELSSFQLIDMKRSPHIAVCLMVVPEHLDWHPDINEYTLAKANLFQHQTVEDTAIYYADNELSHLIASHGKGRKLPFFAQPGAIVDNGEIKIDGQVICRTDELQLLGEHNWQNVCAAVTAVWQVSRNTEALRSAVTSFTGLEHRLELSRELGGVRYYDDSFGTTPETAMVAIKAFSEPKVLILGGSDKGADYTELARAVSQSNIRKVLLIGDQAARIQAALEANGFHDFIPGGQTMTDIVQAAHDNAQDGDVVLLSTGCASFGMFQNYKDRGDQFKAAVQALA